MKKSLIIVILSFLYLACLTGCLFWARKHVNEKDGRLYSEAINSLESYFRGHNRIVTIEYSGEKVKSQQVPLRKINDDVKKKFGPIIDESAELSKKKYLWEEAYGDIYKQYEIIPRYQNDYRYTGFLFRIFEKGYDSVSECTVYPKYVGFRKQSDSWAYQWMPSVQEDIDDGFEFFTKNEKSMFYGDFRSDHISSSDIMNNVGNEYYELWSHKWHQNEDGKMDEYSCGAGYNANFIDNLLDDFLNSGKTIRFYTPAKYEDLNELGYNTWFSNNFARVYLEANPIDALTVRYRFSRGWDIHPMLRDLEKICLWGFILLTILFGGAITLVSLKKKN